MQNAYKYELFLNTHSYFPTCKVATRLQATLSLQYEQCPELIPTRGNRKFGVALITEFPFAAVSEIYD